MKPSSRLELVIPGRTRRRELGDAEPGRDGVREQPGIVHRGQLDEARAVAEAARRRARGAHREPGLADAARPGDGDQP